MARLALLGAGLAVAYVARPGQPASKTTVVYGFSARRQVLGQEVYNDDGEVVGKIDDLIIAKRSVSHVIVSVGGFLGIAAYTVALPVADFVRHGKKIVLPGASKAAIQAMPRFEYSQMDEPTSTP